MSTATLARPQARQHHCTDRTVVTTDGVALSVRDYMPSTSVEHTLVLLHGLCLSKTSWQNQIRDLDGSPIRIIAPDHRGHGRSAPAPRPTYHPGLLANDLAEILTNLGVSGPTTLAGHSMGGMVALSYLARTIGAQPVRPDGLVLVGTAAGGLANHGLGQLLAAPGLDKLTDVIGHVPQSMCDRLMRSIAGPLCDLVTRDKKVSASLASALRATPATTALAFLNGLKTYDQRGTLSAISAVTTVISGGADILTPAVHAEAIAAAVPEAIHVHRPAAGHMLLQEESRVVTDAIVQTVERVRQSMRPPKQTPLHCSATAPALNRQPA